MRRFSTIFWQVPKPVYGLPVFRQNAKKENKLRDVAAYRQATRKRVWEQKTTCKPNSDPMEDLGNDKGFRPIPAPGILFYRM